MSARNAFARARGATWPGTRWATRPATISGAPSHGPQIEGGLDLGGASNYGPSLLGRADDPALVARLDAFLAAHVPANARGPAQRTTAALLYRAGLRAQRVPGIDRLMAAAPSR